MAASMRAIAFLVCLLALSHLAAAAEHRKLLQVNNNGPRQFSKVAQHKQPKAVTGTAKRNYDKTRRFTMASQGNPAATRNLLQNSSGDIGARPFDTVAAHKQPKQPKTNARKSFDRKFPSSTARP